MFVEISCKIPNQSEIGSCKRRDDCPEYNDLFRITTASRISFIKRLNCKDDTEDTTICCPDNGVYK